MENDVKKRRPVIIPSIALLGGILAGEKASQIDLVFKHPIVGLVVIMGCFYFAIKGKGANENKAVCVCFLIGFMLIVLNTYSLDINNDNLSSYSYVRGRVIRIDRLEERTELVLDGISLISVNETGKYEAVEAFGCVLATCYSQAKVGDADNEMDFSLMGKNIQLAMRVEKPKSAGNPGGFDYRKYLYGRNIFAYGQFKASDIKILSDSSSLKYRFYAYMLEKRERFLRESFEEKEDRDFAGGVLFGMGRNISEGLRTEFMEGGAGHVLAVSGLHIGMIYSLCKAIEKKLKPKSVVFRRIILMLVFYVYGTASLWSISVTRAVLLIIAKEIADLCSMRFDSLSALAIISDIMLVAHPYLVFSSGFQMSFLAILGICFLRPRVMHVIKKTMGSSPVANGAEKEDFLSALSTMLSVQVLMVPYTIYVYNRIAIFGILNNWIMIFLAGLYVPLGAGLFLIGVLVDAVTLGGLGLINVSEYLCVSLSFLGSAMSLANKYFLAKGAGVIDAGSPRIFLIAGLFVGVLYLSSEEYKVEKHRYGTKAVFKALWIIAMVSLFIFAITFNPIYFADEVFIDVGQGDSLHIRWNDANLLIDGGGNINYDIGKKTLKPYLLHRGVKKLDLALFTHAHTDHFLGIEQLNDVYPISRIITRGSAGDRIVLDEDHYIDILWPIPGYEDSEDENYYSRIFKVYSRGVTTLITGDITEEGERALMKYYNQGELKSHILKVAHHGSKYSTSPDFIKAVSPIIAIISVGTNNYGHPSPIVIENLERQGIIVYRTDVDGAIGIIIRDGKFFVCGNRKNMHIKEYKLN